MKARTANANSQQLEFVLILYFRRFTLLELVCFHYFLPKVLATTNNTCVPEKILLISGPQLCYLLINSKLKNIMYVIFLSHTVMR